MVNIDPKVYAKIEDYLTYILCNGLCSFQKAKEKSLMIFKKLHSLDGKFYNDKPSTHRSFGKRQGYLYGFFKDKKSKTQWNYLYEREVDPETGEIWVLVHDICCGGLKDSYQFFASLTSMLTERFRLGNMLNEALLK